MEQNSKTWLWAVLAIAVLAVTGWFWRGSWQATVPGTSETVGSALIEEDTAAAIEKELDVTDFGNLEAELQSTEADLQSL